MRRLEEFLIFLCVERPEVHIFLNNINLLYSQTSAADVARDGVEATVSGGTLKTGDSDT